jgi:8-oxo-dGTP pyrophosphatase MutT (NUDIX family)
MSMMVAVGFAYTYNVAPILILYVLYMGAGILPVSIIGNKMYFLFGKESVYDDSPGYSDFGGGTDPGETPIQTAIREGGEELHGFLGNKRQLREHLVKKKYYLVNNDRYSVFMVLIDHDPNLPVYYNNHYDFLFKHLPDNLVHDIIFDHHVFEKQEIRWFSEAELKTKSKMFREFYRPFLKTFLEKRTSILSFFRRGKKYDYLHTHSRGGRTKKHMTRAKRKRRSTTQKNT